MLAFASLFEPNFCSNIERNISQNFVLQFFVINYKSKQNFQPTYNSSYMSTFITSCSICCFRTNDSHANFKPQNHLITIMMMEEIEYFVQHSFHSYIYIYILLAQKFNNNVDFFLCLWLTRLINVSFHRKLIFAFHRFFTGSSLPHSLFFN